MSRVTWTAPFVGYTAPMMRTTWIGLMMVIMGAVGCGDGSTSGGSDGGMDGDVDVDAALPDAGDPTAALFAMDHLIDIDIEMDAADWDDLRTQTRSLFGLLEGDCLAEPFPSPFTFFPATVMVDGTELSEVGVRKKGFLGSLNEVRPSLKIKFDEYVADQEYLGLSRLTLNNSQQDPSFARQCLAYQLFTEAGVPASRCNFARVTVNGDELGLYVHVESVDKKFLARHYADEDGNLYEGTLSDFRDGWTGTFDKKTNEDNLDRSDLEDVTSAAEAGDASLAQSIEGVMDLDQFYTFWATETMISHWDGYAGNTNNFFVYNDPTTGLFQFMPWGVDGTFGNAADPAVFARGLLANRLYLYGPTQDDYLARMRTLVEDLWDTGRLIDSVDQMEAVIQEVTDQAEPALDGLRQYVLDRGDSILDQLDAGDPVWTEPLRDDPCFEVIGDISGTFVTTWGTNGNPDPFSTGSGTLSITVGATVPNIVLVGANSGLNMPTDGSPPRAVVQVVGLLDDGNVAVAYMEMDPSAVTPGTVPLDFASGIGVLFLFTPATGSFVPVGLFGAGDLVFDMAGTTATDPVEGSFSADLLAWPF